ncbi:MAG TPA: ATP-binding cassette domain-containing protein [Thermoanaerobaculia bacterium]|nr:ATP-binding cassette domain-containing protein [Thermoanaerobaculia bacterium]
MIEVHGLTRRYGDFTAVEDVSFSIGSGEILGMLGPNGAGKTTTIRMITGFLPPSAGRVSIAGIDLEERSVEARRQIGYLPENVALYTEMRVREYLAYRARLEGLSGKAAADAIERSIERCLLADVRHQIIGTLSKGYRQRVGLATAILHDPAVLILDEPTVGLDPKQIIAIRELIRELGLERTLLLSTHILPEVELLCQRVVIIDRGRIIAQGTPEGLRQQWLGRTAVTVTIKEAPPDAAELLRAVEGVDGVAADGAPNGPVRFSLECAHGRDPRETIFRLAVERGWVLLELAQAKASLEDIFVRLTTREGEEDGGAAPNAAASDGSGAGIAASANGAAR